VTASAEDFITQTRTIYVSATGWTQLDFQLQPEPAAVGELPAQPEERRLWFDSPMRSDRRVRFHLATTSAVSLDLLEVTGRLAAPLFAGRMPAGDHAILLERGLPAGTYIVRLRAKTSSSRASSGGRVAAARGGPCGASSAWTRATRLPTRGMASSSLR